MSSVEQLHVAFARGSVEAVPKKPPISKYNSLDYAIWRFLHAWHQTGELQADHAVLLRQIVRWNGSTAFSAGKLPPQFIPLIKKAGVDTTPIGDLSAAPFAPNWLWGNFVNAESDIDAKPTVRRLDETVAGESYLELLDYKEGWQSQAQKEAAWLALSAPPNSTTIIALPTGSGKSLCFQLLSRFSKGLTVVVVPTVALAIDQWQSARERLQHIPDVNPLYFAADDSTLNAENVVRDVKDHRTRLIFTSPEACVSGRLRAALENAAREGFFENFVVDEAHIIESWGAFFRVDFQMLSMRREQWLKLSDQTLRTFLLSATFTPQSRATLKTLFGANGEWREFVCQRLRPEMTYFTHRFNGDNEQLDALRECAWRLPRPAIFYTTEVQKAKNLAAFLREEGFSRLGCFHGETPSAQRRQLLEQWREDALDLMVATSAFGLGVDKSDVRAVVHACLPENLHRYYQEVGRGGRDGNSAVCILIPNTRDIKVAEGLAPKYLTEEKLQERWDAMWRTAEAVDADRQIWKINLFARRVELLGQPTGDENVRWNKRLLLQLLRAGKVNLRDFTYVPAKKDSPAAEWAELKINFPAAGGNIGKNISEQREEELQNSFEGLRQMELCLEGQQAVCRVLRRLYKMETPRVCGGCPACRRDDYSFDECPPLEYNVPPTASPKRKVIADFLNPFDERNRGDFKKLLRRIVEQKQLRRFACEERHFEHLLSVFGKAFRKDDLQLYRVDALKKAENFYLSPEESLAFFHVERLNFEALNFSRGKEIWHFIGAEVDFLDAAGKYPGESDGWQFYSSPNEWI